MPRPALQCGHNVFLVSNRRHHDNTSLRMRLHDLFGGLNAFHLRHGDIHEHDVRMSALELADGGQSVTSFGGDLSAKGFDHASQVLAREHGIVHDQVADRLTIFAAFDCCELLHNNLLVLIPSRRFPAGQMTQVTGREVARLESATVSSARRELRFAPRHSLRGHKALAKWTRAHPRPRRAWRSHARWQPWAYRRPHKTLPSAPWSRRRPPSPPPHLPPPHPPFPP